MEQLNLKPKNFKDLLTDEPFTRKDIITIQVLMNYIVSIAFLVTRESFNVLERHHSDQTLTLKGHNAV